MATQGRPFFFLYGLGKINLAEWNNCRNYATTNKMLKEIISSE